MRDMSGDEDIRLPLQRSFFKTHILDSIMSVVSCDEELTSIQICHRVHPQFNSKALARVRWYLTLLCKRKLVQRRKIGTRKRYMYKKIWQWFFEFINWNSRRSSTEKKCIRKAKDECVDEREGDNSETDIRKGSLLSTNSFSSIRVLQKCRHAILFTMYHPINS